MNVFRSSYGSCLMIEKREQNEQNAGKKLTEQNSFTNEFPPHNPPFITEVIIH